MPSKTPREQLGVDLPDPQRVEEYEDPNATGDEQETEERPEWLPEKFKSVDEYNASYKSLEDELRRRGEDQRRLESEVTSLRELIEDDREYRQSQQFQQPQYQTNEAQFRDQLSAAYENDPIGTMAWMAQQYANQTIDMRLQALQNENQPAVQQQVDQQNQMLALTVDRALGDRYDDWGEYKERVAQEIEADPSLLSAEYLASPDATMRQLSRIYENIKARDVLSQAQNGNLVPQELSGMKQRAQTLSGAGVRPGERSEDDEHFERLKAAARGMSYSAWRES